MRPRDALAMAASVALDGNAHLGLNAPRSLHGAVGRRSDGVLVYARNGTAPERCPAHHCEARLIRKLTTHSTVWLARVTRDGKWADSTPCKACMVRLRAAQVDVVYFTTGTTSYAKVSFDRGTVHRLAGMEAYVSDRQPAPGTLFGIQRSPTPLKGQRAF